MKGDQGFPVRIRFTKRGKVRFVSHRDVARAFERAFRIEQLPLSFTHGFSPRPKVSFGLALSVGHESDAEYLDVELARAIDLDPLPAALSAALPEGIDVTGAVQLVERAPALQEAVALVEYRVTPWDAGDRPTPADVLAAMVTRALARRTLPVTRTRKGRESTDDIRPAIRTIELGTDHEGSPELELTLSTQSRGARPARCSRRCRPKTSSSPNTACSAPHNGSSATARGWNRWKPTRSRVPRRRAHHERRNQCPTTRCRKPRRLPRERATARQVPCLGASDPMMWERATARQVPCLAASDPMMMTPVHRARAVGAAPRRTQPEEEAGSGSGSGRRHAGTGRRDRPCGRRRVRPARRHRRGRRSRSHHRRRRRRGARGRGSAPGHADGARPATEDR